jgi:hypothetical protein
MKYDLTHTLVDSDGNPALENESPVTVKTAFVRALLADVSPTGAPLSPDDKLKRYQLFKKIGGSREDTVDLTVEEAAMLKTAAGVFPALVYGQLADFIDAA